MSNRFRFIIKFEGFVANSVPKVRMAALNAILGGAFAASCRAHLFAKEKRERNRIVVTSLMSQIPSLTFFQPRDSTLTGGLETALCTFRTLSIRVSILHSMKNESFFILVLSRVVVV